MKGSEGSWCWEVTEVILRKTDVHGNPYSAVATLKIIDGVPHVIGLLSTVGFNRKDHRDLEKIIRSFGYTEVRFVRGEQMKEIKESKNG